MSLENDTLTLENATQMVSACREEYVRLGFQDAEVLWGMEITDPVAAELALMMVNTLPELECTRGVRSLTIESLLAAMRPKYLKRAS